MHDAGTIGHCDIGVTCHVVGLLVLPGSLLPRAGEQRLVLLVFQVGSLAGLQNLVGGLPLFRQAAQDGVQQGLGHVIGVAVRGFYLYIGLVRVHTQSHVGGQCPRGRSPCQEKGILAHALEPGYGGALFHRLVALGHLVAGQRSAAAGAVGHDFEALVQEPFVPDGLQGPPLGLDVVVMVGHVRVVHVRPETYGAGEFLPHALVFPDALLTLVDERSQTVLLNLLLAVQAQELLHLQFHGQAVGVPAGFPGHHAAFHGAVSGDHVLDGAGLHMADVGLAVGRGRAVVEGVDRAFPATVDALLENLVLPPEFLHFFFTFYRAYVC